MVLLPLLISLSTQASTSWKFETTVDSETETVVKQKPYKKIISERGINIAPFEIQVKADKNPGLNRAVLRILCEKTGSMKEREVVSTVLGLKKVGEGEEIVKEPRLQYKSVDFYQLKLWGSLTEKEAGLVTKDDYCFAEIRFHHKDNYISDIQTDGRESLNTSVNAPRNLNLLVDQTVKGEDVIKSEIRALEHIPHEVKNLSTDLKFGKNIN